MGFLSGQDDVLFLHDLEQRALVHVRNTLDRDRLALASAVVVKRGHDALGLDPRFLNLASLQVGD